MPRQAFIFHPGKYYVKYNDGGRSMCMSKAAAKNYSKVFGGTVHRHKDFPTLLDRLKKFFS